MRIDIIMEVEYNRYKRGKEVITKMWKRLLLLMCALGLTSTILCGCKSDEVKIQERLDAVVFAFNSGDMEGVLDCYDAKTRNVNKAVLGIGDSLLGMGGIDIGLSSMFALAVGLRSNGELVRIEDVQITMNSDRTVAKVEAVLCYEDTGSAFDAPLQITMVKENGDWYITP